MFAEARPNAELDTSPPVCVCLEEGGCHVVENFHDQQRELNYDGGLCNCWGSKVTAS